MARGGIREDEAGNFDHAANDFEDLSRYSAEDQEYLRNNSKTRINGKEVADDGKSGIGSRKWGKKNDGTWGLRKAEEEASAKPNTNGRGGDKKASLGEKENNVESDGNKAAGGGGFKNAVKGIMKKNAKIGRNKSTGGRRYGPMVTVFVSLIVCGVAGFLGQASMPFSLISQFQESFDSISVSQGLRSKAWLKTQMRNIDGPDDVNVRSCIKAKYFGSDKFSVTGRQKRKLAKQNITFEKDTDGVKIMKYIDDTGKTHKYVADEKLATADRPFFNEAYSKNDAGLGDKYDAGSRTWRGSVGAWFDKGMENVLKKMGVYRGVWKDFKKANSDADAKKVKQTFAAETDSDSTKTTVTGHEKEGVDKTDENGNKVYQTDADGNTIMDADGNSKTSKSAVAAPSEDVTLARSDVKVDENGNVKDVSALKSKVGTIANKVSKVSSAFQGAVNVQCGVMDVVGSITAIVAAYQALQVIKVAAAMFEGIQKAQAGDTDGAPLNEIANSLTQQTSTTYTEVKGVKKVSEDNYEPDESKTKVTRRENVSAMQSNGITSTYAREAVDPDDPSVKSFNTNSTTKNLFSGLASVLNSVDISAKSFRSCTVARMAAAVAGAVVDTISIVACIFTAGLGCLVDALLDAVGTTLIGMAVAGVISIVVAYLVPHVAQVLIRKIATEVAGEDLGNALVSGANSYMGQNHQFSGGAPASKERLVSYLQERDKIVAENARFERSTRSPFDITSKYTFLGNLAFQLVPLASSLTSITSAVKGVSTVVGNAVSSLNPTSSATSAAIEAQVAADQTEANCPDMFEIGAVGDAFCNPYIITDTRTIETDPADIVNKVDLLDDNLEATSDGTTKIKQDSDLAKYIIYCGQRSSQWGAIDQNIASSVEKGTTGNTLGDAAIGGVPVVGDVVDIVSNKSKLNNIGWITGRSCVVDNPEIEDEAETIGWKDAQVYQRFVEDQRLAEAEGLVEESAVSKFVAEYYEEHPLDNSYEGILARYSGLPKEKVEVALTYMEVQDFVANYEPAKLYPYPQSDEEKPRIEIQSEPSIIAQNAIVDGLYHFESRRAQLIA